MLGDICPTHQCQTNECGCAAAEPCLPASATNVECKDWISLSCAFWTGDPIPGTPIEKGTRGSAIVLYLLERIKALETP